MKKVMILGVAVVANLTLSSAFFGAYERSDFDCDNTCGLQCSYLLFVEHPLYKTMRKEAVSAHLSGCMQACVGYCPQQQDSCGQTLGN